MTSLAFGPTDRVMVLAPHPDDEVLAAGALVLEALAAGASVRVVFATDGEANPWVQRIVERRVRLRPADAARFGVRRRGEAFASLSLLGIAPADVEFLALPDAGITELVRAEDPRPEAAVRAAIAGANPTILVTPSPSDIHPDHGTLGVLVRGVLAGHTRPPELRAALEYVVHAIPGLHRAPGDVVVSPSRADVLRLRAAMRRHEAPMAWHRGRFLARVGRPAAFTTRGAEGAPIPSHPVLRATRDATAVTLEIHGRARPGAFGAAELQLLVGIADGSWRSLHIPLGATGETDVVRPRSGGAGACARVDRFAGHARVRLSTASIAPEETVYAKVERRLGFFDEAGWLEIPAIGDANRPPVKDASTTAPRVVVVVPCFNVSTLCGPVLDAVARRADYVIAVDDGSTDGTAGVLARCAAAQPGRMEVLSVPVNRGKGAALLAAFTRALELGPFDALVTLDGDGQHRPEDVPAVAAGCVRGAALTIGARQAFHRMPMRSRLGNTFTSVAVGRLCRGGPKDTQSGLRGHSRAFVEEIVRTIRGTRYETELRILLLALSRGMRVVSVPIPTVYIDGNRSSHFRPLVDGMRVWGALASWALFDRGRAAPSVREKGA